jgi:excisionase family DNA binding protein
MATDIDQITVYTVQEVAQAMKVTPQTVRAWIKAGKLKAEVVGKTYMISEKSILDYVETYKS